MPPIDAKCTAEKGKRVCLSAVCEIDDDLCGLKDGSPCTGGGQCRTGDCKTGVCGGCTADASCKKTEVCQLDQKQCVPGCREVSGQSNCVAPKRCSQKDGTVGQCVDGGGVIDDTNNVPYTENDIIEGG